MVFRIAIVDDEKKALEQTQALLSKYAEEKGLLFSYSPFESSFLFLETFKADLYDIVFLDIRMPGINGLDTAKELRGIDPNVVLIFVTDFAQFAIRGYEVNAYDFIVKPVKDEHLVLVMDKLIPVLERRKSANTISVKSGAIVTLLHPEDILYIEVKSHYSMVHTKDKILSLNVPLRELEEKLTPLQPFFRCNNCYLVNLSYVSEVEKFDLTLVNGERLAISHPKRKAFMAALMSYLGEEVG